MKIAVDAFGGDHAPDEIIKGSAMAVAEYGVEVVLCGNEKVVRARIKDLGISENGLSFRNAEGVILIEDNPVEITRDKKNSSMAVAFQCVAEGGADAFVSGGSTAAIAIGGRKIVGTLPKVRRAALGPIIPTAKTPFILIDAGLNTNCRAAMLEQFAVMGSVYMHKIYNIPKPRVGLLNIGAEPEKGRDLEREVYALLSENTTVNFIGNAEARGIPLGLCDVVVTDGYTGNIFLKTIEGMGKYIKVSMKELFMRNALTKIGGLLSNSGIKAFADKMDYRRVGGSPLIGTVRPVIKAHGSCEAYAFKNAVKQAVDFAEKGVVDEMIQNLSLLSAE